MGSAPAAGDEATSAAGEGGAGGEAVEFAAREGIEDLAGEGGAGAVVLADGAGVGGAGAEAEAEGEDASCENGEGKEAEVVRGELDNEAGE